MEPFAKLTREVKEQRAGLVEHVVSGAVPDYAAYSKAVGALQALDLVLVHIAELEKKMLEE